MFLPAREPNIDLARIVFMDADAVVFPYQTLSDSARASAECFQGECKSTQAASTVTVENWMPGLREVIGVLYGSKMITTAAKFITVRFTFVGRNF